MSEKMPNENMDPMWKTRMEILMKRMKNIEIAEKIDKALYDWYSERGMEVPNWKLNKDPDWWIKYLQELEEEQ
jgi:alkyl sulfatase BDS1-like metallo-beta-lactamase superfamily hydrolase